MKWRDRIKELRRVSASELRSNPRNWRAHPDDQRRALRGILDEVGIAGALLARETDDGLELIDGHLRTDMDEATEWPVLVLDVDEAEADLLLATVDPIAAMGARNDEALAGLLAGIEADSAELSAMLDGLAGQLPVGLQGGRTVEDPETQWDGMPEFEHADLTSLRRIVVHFKSDKDASDFGELLGQTVTEKTRAIWFPPDEIGRTADKVYGENE